MKNHTTPDDRTYDDEPYPWQRLTFPARPRGETGKARRGAGGEGEGVLPVKDQSLIDEMREAMKDARSTPRERREFATS